MYKIYRRGKRFNNKQFASYEDARKYVRRWITKELGVYFDNISSMSFSITK
jgi:hypothetical protein